MKKILLVFCLLLPLFIGAQTQQESENWIISKINKYKEPTYFGNSDLSSISKITVVSFINCQLTIINTNEGDRNNNGKKVKFKSTFTIKIPLSNLTKVTYNEITHELLLETEKDNIIWTTNDPDFPANNQTTYNKFIGFKINLNTEENLFDRMNNAFKHLKNKYCNSNSTPKEAF